jgi:apolipoprotein D and lipocalin family protein
MSKQSSIFALSLACTMMVISACKLDRTTEPQPVKNFELEKYLGTWHEIARIENSFEKGCNGATANYSKLEKGGIKVFNTCVRLDGKTKQATGKAFFRGDETTGALKVSFFWPFYGKYNVLYVDKTYEHAIVGGGSKKYFWILSRTKTVDEKTMQKLIKKTAKLGFPVEKLVYPKTETSQEK